MRRHELYAAAHYLGLSSAISVISRVDRGRAPRLLEQNLLSRLTERHLGRLPAR